MVVPLVALLVVLEHGELAAGGEGLHAPACGGGVARPPPNVKEKVVHREEEGRQVVVLAVAAVTVVAVGVGVVMVPLVVVLLG